VNILHLAASLPPPINLWARNIFPQPLVGLPHFVSLDQQSSPSTTPLRDEGDSMLQTFLLFFSLKICYLGLAFTYPMMGIKIFLPKRPVSY